MNRNQTSVLHISTLAAVLAAGVAAAQSPTLTASQCGGDHVIRDGRRVLPAAVCWYNGDLDLRDALTSERNTAVPESWTFDDVEWPGGIVAGFRGHWLLRDEPVIVAADIVVYSGMSEGNFGSLIASVNDVPVALTRTGNEPWGFVEHLVEADLGGNAFSLDPGHYHVGLRVVGSGLGQAFVAVTSGANAIGTPPGNNGQTFLQSEYFNYPTPTDWQNLMGPGTWDVSYGLVCGEGGGFEISLSGDCPGQKTLAWTGAGPGQMGIVIANETGSFTIPGGPCEGTQLGLGSAGLQLYNVIGTQGGTGEVNANVGQGACGKYVQCVKTDDCQTSNVVGPI